VRNCAVLFIIVSGLIAGTAFAVENGPATLPTGEPSATQPENVSSAITTAPAATQPGGSSLATTTAPAATQPQFIRTTDGVALPSTAPSTNPTTAPIATTNPTTRPVALSSATPAADSGTAPQPSSGSTNSASAQQILPHDYFILAVRSIFQKGSHVTRGFDSPARPASASANPSTSSAAVVAAAASAAPEESLVFEGVMVIGNQNLAFIEDRNAGKMLMLQNGERIARGKIAGITLDTLDYAVDGAVLHVQIGQNLRGEAPQAASGGSAVASGSTTAPSAAPAGSAAAPAGGSQRLPGEDIIHYLQRRRAEGN
jgi:hypothetical protein